MVTVDSPTIDVSHKYLVLNVTTPPNTPTLTTSFDVGQRIVELLDVFWPPGANGLVGLQAIYSGLTILPWNQPGSFLVADGERRKFELALPVYAPLSIVTQNNDLAFAHTIVITADLIERPNDLGPNPTPLLTFGGESS